jgi:hypothetical protein
MEPDPAVFIINLQKANKKTIFSCLLLFAGTITSFFKKTSQKEVAEQKDYESRFFLLFLLDYRRIRIRVRTSD